MVALRGPVIFVVVLLLGHPLTAQRIHELQLQLGILHNTSVTFYDYHETPDIRHNFEFDQSYASQFYSISWHYPVNGYVEVGLFLTRSLNAYLNLVEAESGVFNSENGTSLRPDTLFLGTTKLKSNFTEMGVHLRINLARLKKLKTYLILSPSMATIQNIDHRDNQLQMENQDLKQDLLNSYLVSETRFLLGIGLGFSYPLGNGFNLKILEIYAKNVPRSSNILGSMNSLELRSGVSYQFYRRK